MKDIRKDESGAIVRFQTKRMNVSVARPQYGSATGEARYSKRFYYAKMINGQLVRFPLSSDAKEAEIMADQIAGFLQDPTKTLDDVNSIRAPYFDLTISLRLARCSIAIGRTGRFWSCRNHPGSTTNAACSWCFVASMPGERRKSLSRGRVVVLEWMKCSRRGAVNRP